MLYVAAVMFAFFKVSNLSAPSLSRITPTLPAAAKADSALSGIATQESHWSEQFSNFDDAKGLSQGVLMKMTKELLLLRSKAVLEMTKELEETPEDELEKAFEEANALELVDEKKWMQASGFLADTARLGVNDQTRGELARKLFDIMTGSEKWAEAQFLVLAVAERAAELYIVGMSKELAKHHRAEGNRGGVLDLVKGLTAYPKLQEELMKGFTSVRVAGGGVDEAELREAIKTGSWDDVHRLAAEASAEMLDKILPGREKGDSVFAKVMGRGDAAGMTEALIPSWVRRIPPFAFAGCAGLQHVRFEAGGGGRVEEIGEGAFARCKGLERFELPRLVKRIEKRTFYGCEELKEVKGLGGVDLVAERAFENCYALEGAELGVGGEGARDVEIGVEGFVCCSLMEKLVLGLRVKKVGHRAFAG
ncbi:hypothetical protein TeGR_g9764, partial [Tetraparma gracilis]